MAVGLSSEVALHDDAARLFLGHSLQRREALVESKFGDTARETFLSEKIGVCRCSLVVIKINSVKPKSEVVLDPVGDVIVLFSCDCADTNAQVVVGRNRRRGELFDRLHVRFRTGKWSWLAVFLGVVRKIAAVEGFILLIERG